MSNFLSNMIFRHSEVANSVSPRPKSLYEQNNAIPQRMTSFFQILKEKENSPEEGKRPGVTEKENFPQGPSNDHNSVPTEENRIDKEESDIHPLDQHIPEKLSKHFSKSGGLPINTHVSQNQPSPKQSLTPPASDLDKKKEWPNALFHSPNAIQHNNYGNSATQETAHPQMGHPEEVQEAESITPSSISSKNPLLKRIPSFQWVQEKTTTKKTGEEPAIKGKYEPFNEPTNTFTPQESFYLGGGDSWGQMSEKKPLPDIKIHIGRIEIKAVNQQTGSIRKGQDPIKPRISLNQFLDNKRK